MSGAAHHNEGHGLWPIVGVVFLCIFAVLAFAALAFPKETTTLFISLNEKVMGIFESSLFIKLRFVFGILTVGLAGLATWLFFRLLEMEKEHEDHVYHHAEHAAHAHTEDHAVSHTVSTPHTSVEIEHESHDHTQSKTAPPPASIHYDKIPGESGVRGIPTGGEEHAGHYQWQSVLRLATSQNPSDWKLAIIEADVILDMMTYIQGFQGDTLGERLKNADPGFFQTLKYAKQAHYMRNQIAHEANIELTPRDVNQTIRMYEAVFNEFKYI
jgi:hypothetical protein